MSTGPRSAVRLARRGRRTRRAEGTEAVARRPVAPEARPLARVGGRERPAAARVEFPGLPGRLVLPARSLHRVALLVPRWARPERRLALLAHPASRVLQASLGRRGEAPARLPALPVQFWWEAVQVLRPVRCRVAAAAESLVHGVPRVGPTPQPTVTVHLAGLFSCGPSSLWRGIKALARAAGSREECPTLL